MQHYEVVVVGGGPAGLAAAIEARKNGAESVVVLERDRELGGILQQCIHHGFGLVVFNEELTGPEYAERFIDELMNLGIEYRLETMVLEVNDDKTIRAISPHDGMIEIQAKAVVLNMGCRERTRGAIAIPGFRPAGVFSAGTAQRFVNMEGYMVGKRVVILGSGDIGLIMARRMSLEGAKVLAVAEIMPYSGGLTRNIVQCLHDYDIPLYLSHTITEVRGKDRVEGVTIAEVDENRKPMTGTEKHYDCDTLLLSVGLIPENELSRGAGIQLDPVTGGPIVNEAMETSVPGIFAAGNVVHVHDLVDWVTEESRRAGAYAARYVQDKLVADASVIAARPGNGIGYVVPHKVRPENLDDKLAIFMRVKQVFHDAKLVVKADGEVVYSRKKRHMAPGEMEIVQIDAQKLKDLKPAELLVSVEGGETEHV